MGGYTCTIRPVISVLAFNTLSMSLFPLLWAPNCVWCGEGSRAQLSGPGLMADICFARLLQTLQPLECILQVVWPGAAVSSAWKNQ